MSHFWRRVKRDLISIRAMQQHNKFITKLKGPIIIFGAGGFVGFNLLQKILRYRKDVFGVFSNPKRNWRLRELHTSLLNVVKCDI